MQSNEFIKKQTVYEILDKMKKIRDQNPAGLISDAVSASIRCVEDSVMVAHAEDVAPVVHGRWETDTCHFYCSICGKYSDYKTNYCPNCGAKMDKDGDGDV